MAEDQNILTDRLRRRQSTQDNIWTSEIDEQPTSANSSLTGIEHTNGRITKLEHSIVELTNTINGVMNELMDQKSILNQMKNNLRNVNQSNIETESIQKSGHLLRPRSVHDANDRSATKDTSNVNVNVNDTREGNSRMQVRHNPDAGASRGSSNPKSDYIIADIDKSTRKTDAVSFKGEYIIAGDSPASGTKKRNVVAHYNELEDVVVYEKGAK